MLGDLGRAKLLQATPPARRPRTLCTQTSTAPASRRTSARVSRGDISRKATTMRSRGMDQIEGEDLERRQVILLSNAQWVSSPHQQRRQSAPNAPPPNRI